MNEKELANITEGNQPVQSNQLFQLKKEAIIYRERLKFLQDRLNSLLAQHEISKQEEQRKFIKAVNDEKNIQMHYQDSLKEKSAQLEKLTAGYGQLQTSYTGLVAREQNYLAKIEVFQSRSEKLNANYLGMYARNSANITKLKSLELLKKKVEKQLEKMTGNYKGMLSREEKYKSQINLLSHELYMAKRSFFRKAMDTLAGIFKSNKSNTESFTSSMQFSHSRVAESKKIIQQEKLIPKLILKLAKPKIAAIMDEFTFSSYSPEAEILQILPENIEQQLNDFQPDLIFIESAWQGINSLWNTKVSNNSTELMSIFAWGRANNIPSLFWNKEDPVHYETFKQVAKQADYVFTTDIDCIPHYKKDLDHERVYVLPFAAQPKYHNPIEIFERKNAFNFAGSYYLRYPQRQRDFAALIDAVKNFKSVEIYDRNFNNPHPHYMFPPQYQNYILGNLPFSEIDKAYKGYRYGINMNTIKQSQSMFARRVFELLASNTVVVSNFSRGVRTLFGDLVISSDEQSQLTLSLDKFCNDDLAYKKFRLLGLRKVMAEHTYGARLDYICSKLSDSHDVNQEKLQIILLSKADNEIELKSIIRTFEKQSYHNKTLMIVTGLILVDSDSENVKLYSDEKLLLSDLRKLAGSFVGILHPNDYYGVSYLQDLALVPVYNAAKAFGKCCYFRYNDDGTTSLENNNLQYKYTDRIELKSGLVEVAIIVEYLEKQGLLNTDLMIETPTLSIDEFNYCRNAGNCGVLPLVDDIDVSDCGAAINHIYKIAESLTANDVPVAANSNNLPQLTAKELFSLLNKPASSKIKIDNNSDLLTISHKLGDKKHAYIYLNKVFTREEFNLETNSTFNLVADVAGKISTVFEFQDESGVKISHSMTHAGGEHTLAIPNECRKVRFGLKLVGSGSIKIKSLILGSNGVVPATVLGKSKTLVLTKQYPAYDDLYRYGFLHSRIRAYKKAGINVDVFRISDEVGNPYREFEDIDVVSGGATLLDATLRNGQYTHVLVHLIDENMWSILKKYANLLRITIWVHGAEIQVWQRREFEFELMNKEEIIRQKKLSDKRVKLWKEIFSQENKNLHFIFVSQYFADESIKDIGVTLDKSFYSVIHNFIDNNIFKYYPKNVEDRLKLLSIRPFASRKYANDITIKAIELLSTKKFFNELTFTIIGDGDLFDNTVAPIKSCSNVNLIKSFMNHQQITQVHSQHGIFITPTRMDAQGVSRDEAMSSGLVAITTNNTAIPEFVDNNCGVVVQSENPQAIADAIEYLYNNPEQFLELSKAGAQRVNQQSGFEQTIAKEIFLILNRKGK
ncbi:MAG: glycosyltransferase [Burkholderiales bacterium]|nr:glycosyltransferase [Burkholderiales bacterium]